MYIKYYIYLCKDHLDKWKGISLLTLVVMNVMMDCDKNASQMSQFEQCAHPL
jgi:hypothetical protein